MVFVKSVKSYDTTPIRKAIEEGLARLGFSVDNKKLAVLKPNLVLGISPSSGVITHPVVTGAMVEVLKAHGVKDIVILEGPGLGQEPRKVFKDTGYDRLADELGVSLLCTDEVEREIIEFKYGRLDVPKIVLDSDLYINIPKMKTHGLTVVTLGLKNQKGIVPALWKKLMHNYF